MIYDNKVLPLDLNKKAKERSIQFDLDSAEYLLEFYEFIKKV